MCGQCCQTWIVLPDVDSAIICTDLPQFFRLGITIHGLEASLANLDSDGDPWLTRGLLRWRIL